mmetsp:Transcript_126/g.318  ORF Transcript_126/g.318 Transcript_126/m.318 type:complete len:282 (+) Transcript_126:56-901(+)
MCEPTRVMRFNFQEADPGMFGLALGLTLTNIATIACVGWGAVARIYFSLRMAESGLKRTAPYFELFGDRAHMEHMGLIISAAFLFVPGIMLWRTMEAIRRSNREGMKSVLFMALGNLGFTLLYMVWALHSHYKFRKLDDSVRDNLSGERQAWQALVDSIMWQVALLTLFALKAYLAQAQLKKGYVFMKLVTRLPTSAPSGLTLTPSQAQADGCSPGTRVTAYISTAAGTTAPVSSQGSPETADIETGGDVREPGDARAEVIEPVVAEPRPDCEAEVCSVMV